MGHKVSDYKKSHKVPEKNKIVYKGRVFALTEEEAQEAPTVVHVHSSSMEAMLKYCLILVPHILSSPMFLQILLVTIIENLLIMNFE